VPQGRGGGHGALPRREPVRSTGRGVVRLSDAPPAGGHAAASPGAQHPRAQQAAHAAWDAGRAVRSLSLSHRQPARSCLAPSYTYRVHGIRDGKGSAHQCTRARGAVSLRMRCRFSPKGGSPAEPPRRCVLTLPRCVLTLPRVCVNPTQVCVNPTQVCVLTLPRCVLTLPRWRAEWPAPRFWKTLRDAHSAWHTLLVSATTKIPGGCVLRASPEHLGFCRSGRKHVKRFSYRVLVLDVLTKMCVQEHWKQRNRYVLSDHCVHGQKSEGWFRRVRRWLTMCALRSTTRQRRRPRRTSRCTWCGARRSWSETQTGSCAIIATPSISTPKAPPMCAHVPNCNVSPLSLALSFSALKRDVWFAWAPGADADFG
jgi:hypothetical protein